MEHFGEEKSIKNDHQVSEESSHELRVKHPTINERRLVTKIDLKILPILCIVYLMAFIDRYAASLLLTDVHHAESAVTIA